MPGRLLEGAGDSEGWGGRAAGPGCAQAHAFAGMTALSARSLLAPGRVGSPVSAPASGRVTSPPQPPPRAAELGATIDAAGREAERNGGGGLGSNVGGLSAKARLR